MIKQSFIRAFAAGIFCSECANVFPDFVNAIPSWFFSQGYTVFHPVVIQIGLSDLKQKTPKISGFKILFGK